MDRPHSESTPLAGRWDVVCCQKSEVRDVQSGTFGAKRDQFVAGIIQLPGGVYAACMGISRGLSPSGVAGLTNAVRVSPGDQQSLKQERMEELWLAGSESALNPNYFHGLVVLTESRLPINRFTRKTPVSGRHQEGKGTTSGQENLLPIFCDSRANQCDRIGPKQA